MDDADDVMGVRRTDGASAGVDTDTGRHIYSVTVNQDVEMSEDMLNGAFKISMINLLW